MYEHVVHSMLQSSHSRRRRFVRITLPVQTFPKVDLHLKQKWYGVIPSIVTMPAGQPSPLDNNSRLFSTSYRLSFTLNTFAHTKQIRRRASSWSVSGIGWSILLFVRMRRASGVGRSGENQRSWRRTPLQIRFRSIYILIFFRLIWSFATRLYGCCQTSLVEYYTDTEVKIWQQQTNRPPPNIIAVTIKVPRRVSDIPDEPFVNFKECFQL